MHHFEAHELADSWELRAGLLDADPADASISACLRECAAALRNIAVPCAAVGADDARDAARFRWLIENARTGSIGFGDWWINADEPASLWRDAIDAEMAAHPPVQGSGS